MHNSVTYTIMSHPSSLVDANCLVYAAIGYKIGLFGIYVHRISQVFKKFKTS